MSILNFFYAATLFALGIFGLLSADDPESIRALALPGFFFGGATLFCSFYALKEPRHGMAGVSFLAFLALLTSGRVAVGTLVQGSDRTTPHFLVNTIMLGVSAIFVLVAVLTWRKRRRAHALAALLGEEDAPSSP